MMYKKSWVIPMTEVLDDLRHTDHLCAIFHFRTESLVEAAVHEWFKTQLKHGPYGMDHIFTHPSSISVDELQEAFIKPEDKLIRKEDVSTTEKLIQLAYLNVSEILEDYIKTFGLNFEGVNNINLSGWRNKCLLVRLY